MRNGAGAPPSLSASSCYRWKRTTSRLKIHNLAHHLRRREKETQARTPHARGWWRWWWRTEVGRLQQGGPGGVAVKGGGEPADTSHDPPFTTATFSFPSWWHVFHFVFSPRRSVCYARAALVFRYVISSGVPRPLCLLPPPPDPWKRRCRRSLLPEELSGIPKRHSVADDAADQTKCASASAAAQDYVVTPRPSSPKVGRPVRDAHGHHASGIPHHEQALQFDRRPRRHRSTPSRRWRQR